MTLPKVLVACPTFDDKAYALEAWVTAYESLIYPRKDVFVVDNTAGTLDYTRRVRFYGLTCAYQAPMPTWWDTLDMCWLRIIERAHDVGAEFILSLEQDIIVPPPTIEVMLLAAGVERAVVTHRYRPRGPFNANDWYETLGCTLIPTDLLYTRRFALYTRFEIALFNLLRAIRHPLVRLHDQLQLIHLN